MSAIVVQCPSCSSRFNLASERVPARGARVRCSRCQHRFYVTANGEVTETRPQTGTHPRQTDPSVPAQAEVPAQERRAGDRRSGDRRQSERATSSDGARAAPRVAPTRPLSAAGSSSDDPDDEHRSPWSLRAGPDPEEDTDLENPEFLFDGPKSGGDSGAVSVGAPDRSDDASAFELGSTTPEPQSPAHAADATASEGEREPPTDDGIPDIRAVRDELAAQRAMAALAAADDEPGDEEFVARSSDVWSELPGSEEASEGGGDQVPPAARQEPSEPSAAPRVTLIARPASESADDLDEGDDDAWTPKAPPPRDSDTGSRPAESPRSERVERSARVKAAFDSAPPVERGASHPRLAAWLATAMGLLLVLGGLRAVYLGSLHVAPGPEQVRVGAWEASEVSVSHLRDRSGALLLVVRGALRGQGRAPAIRVTLVDGRGRALGEPHTGWAAHVEDAELRAAEASALAPRRVSPGPISAFTVVIPDPHPDTRRVSLSLEG